MGKMPPFDLAQFAQITDSIRKKAMDERRLINNPSDEELRVLVGNELGVRKTIYGNFVAESEPSSRAAMFTKNGVDCSFGEEEQKLLTQCEKALAEERLISVDRIVGNENSETTVRLIVPERFAHVAYGGRNLYLPVEEEIEQPTYEIVMFADEAFEVNKSKPLPEKDITIRLAMLDNGRVIKVVRNSNYIGEYKKGVFASEDWLAKTRRGGIFLHAGCREDYLQSTHGDYRTSRSLFLALTANGKTTLTSRILARKGKEKSWTEDGDFDFYNFERTSNGRAVIHRRDFCTPALILMLTGLTT